MTEVKKMFLIGELLSLAHPLRFAWQGPGLKPLKVAGATVFNGLDYKETIGLRDIQTLQNYCKVISLGIISISQINWPRASEFGLSILPRVGATQFRSLSVLRKTRKR
jgi:hypothetical protein